MPVKTIQVTLNNHQVRVPIGELGETIYHTNLEILRERMELMRDLAKVYVNVDTGSLRDSIRMEWIGEGRRIGSVVAGGRVTNPKTGKLVDYAAALEAKYPYMYPAYLDSFREIEAAIKTRVFERV